jgi:hypothetical protein
MPAAGVGTCAAAGPRDAGPRPGAGTLRWTSNVLSWSVAPENATGAHRRRLADHGTDVGPDGSDDLLHASRNDAALSASAGCPGTMAAHFAAPRRCGTRPASAGVSAGPAGRACTPAAGDQQQQRRTDRADVRRPGTGQLAPGLPQGQRPIACGLPPALPAAHQPQALARQPQRSRLRLGRSRALSADGRAPRARGRVRSPQRWRRAHRSPSG